jgi:hypothetical protein
MTARWIHPFLFTSLLFLHLGGCAGSSGERTLTTEPRTTEAGTTTTPPSEPGAGKDDPQVLGSSVDADVSSTGGDRDGDGLLDSSDKCPDDPEDFDAFQDDDGCPDADNDGDGIPDVNDQCPGDPEDLDGFQDADGCPD